MPHPKALHNDARTGALEIVWDDDTRQQLDGALLRRRCPCADCKSLRRKNGAEADKITPPTPAQIKDIRLVGAYAAQITFSDGHDRGIFPWVYLKDLEQSPQE
jgi:DUF971 family protein